MNRVKYIIKSDYILDEKNPDTFPTQIPDTFPTQLIAS